MKNSPNKIKIFTLLACLLLFGGWGSVGHKLINRVTVSYFPSSLLFLASWSDSISIHASDADNRKSSDPNEDIKHYIDIDNYSDFQKNRRIIQNYDSIVAVYGQTFVTTQGTLPWAIIITCDSLKSAFKRKDWHKAMLFASDLGHYVGDAHMPLHITRNYNGQYSSQSGVHSRYESDLIGKYSTQIVFGKDTAEYVSNISDYSFSMIYGNYIYVDSVLNADKLAKAAAGSSSGTFYLQKFWEYSNNFTTLLFNKASVSLGNLIYTCWVNAGSPTNVSDVETAKVKSNEFTLTQNYPNPFNPTTVINYQLNSPGYITLKIYDNLGREISTLVNSYQNTGTYQVNFDASKLTSGVYIYRIKVGNKLLQSKKMILVR